jgi:FtsH-binding integral membrane protein
MEIIVYIALVIAVLLGWAQWKMALRSVASKTVFAFVCSLSMGLFLAARLPSYNSRGPNWETVPQHAVQQMLIVIAVNILGLCLQIMLKRKGV